MSQNSTTIPDSNGVTFLTNLNNALGTIETNHSGATAPTAPFAGMTWMDTTTNLLKVRNTANTAWKTVLEDEGLHASTAKTIPLDADEIAILDSSTSFTTKKVTFGSLRTILDNAPFRNRIINGDMDINQINGSTAVTPTITGATYISDGYLLNTSIGSKLTFQQVVDAPTGFKYSTKITVASQYAPIATDIIVFQQRIEGQMITDFALGTAGAVTLNTSNWIKGSVAGIYSVVISNGSGNRTYIGTINVTTSWTKVSITLVGDTTGTWSTDNTIGMSWNLDLGSGSNYNSTANIWQGGGFRTASSVTFINQVAGSTLNITGVQLEKVPTGATVGTDFEFLPTDVQMMRCQRYLPVFGGVGSDYFPAGATGTTTGLVTILLKVPTRIPTTSAVLTGLTGALLYNGGGVGIALTGVTFAIAGNNTVLCNATVASGLTAGQSSLLALAGNKLIFIGAQL